MEGQASPLFGSLEEAATVAGGGATAGEEMDALLSGLRTKHAARRAEAVPSPVLLGSRASRQETALRRNHELGQRVSRPAGSGGGGTLDAIAANAERLQAQAAQLSLHESTKELLETERNEWRREVSTLKSAVKTKDAEMGAMERRCDLLERTCANQAEARDREHNALTTRVAQLELTIELWVTEMSTGLKPERSRSSASILRANSSSSAMIEAGSPLPLPMSPATAHRREGALQQLKASGDAATMMVAPPDFGGSGGGGGGDDAAEGAEGPSEIGSDGATSMPEPADESS